MLRTPALAWLCTRRALDPPGPRVAASLDSTSGFRRRNMPEKDERRSRRYVGLAVVVLACVACSAQSPPPTPSPIVESLNTYLDDSHRARLPDGRMINIVCKGEGSPTVVFTAGLGDWSVVWGQVQPRISERTRTCAWDRPGFGFSSPSKAAQTVLTTTSDLRAALAAAGIAAPYVLVGHSFGGFETLVFTDRHRADVAGIVLVDPSTPRQLERFARVLGDSSAMQRTLEAQTATIERCVDAARAGTLATGSGDPDNCLGLNPAFPA